MAARVGSAARVGGRDRRSARGARRHRNRRPRECCPPPCPRPPGCPCRPPRFRRATETAVSPPPPPYDVVASRVRAIMDSIANHDETLSRQGAILEAISAALGARVDGGQAVGSTTSAGSAAGPSDSAPCGASGGVSPSHLPRRACACCNSFSFRSLFASVLLLFPSFLSSSPTRSVRGCEQGCTAPPRHELAREGGTRGRAAYERQRPRPH